MKKLDKNRTLKFLLILLLLKLVLAVLVIALLAVIGYILLREYQYGVSEEYYDSLRNTGLLKGGRSA